jgi:hypothetical protein
MDFDFGGFGGRPSLYLLLAGALLCVAAVVWGLLRRVKLLGAERRRERRRREELQAYARLDVRVSENGGSHNGLPGGDIRDLGRRVCRTVAEVRAFPRAAMLAKDAEGRLFVAGNAEMDDLTVQALNGWGERAKGPRLSLNMGGRDGSVGGAGQRLGLRDPATVKPWMRSFALELRQEPAVKLARAAGLEQVCAEVWVAPLWTTGGRMIGAVAVCGTEGLGGVRGC